MKTLAFIITLLVAGLVLLALLRHKASSSGSSAEWPFYAKRLLTQPEQVLYHRLVKALPDHVVFAQVQVSRVLGVKKASTSTPGTTASTD